MDSFSNTAGSNLNDIIMAFSLLFKPLTMDPHMACNTAASNINDIIRALSLRSRSVPSVLR